MKAAFKVSTHSIELSMATTSTCLHFCRVFYLKQSFESKFISSQNVISYLSNQENVVIVVKFVGDEEMLGFNFLANLISSVDSSCNFHHKERSFSKAANNRLEEDSVVQYNQIIFLGHPFCRGCNLFNVSYFHTTFCVCLSHCCAIIIGVQRVVNL